jgi:hypothetical protein
MADRTSCTLVLYGVATRETLDHVYDRIEQSCFSDRDVLVRAFEGKDCDGYLHLEEINHGLIDPIIANALKTSGISYQWRWDSGLDYAAGVEIYDARDDYSRSYYTINGQVGLTLAELRNPNAQSEAEAFQERLLDLRKIGLHIAESAHDEVAIIAENPHIANAMQRVRAASQHPEKEQK